MGIDLGLARQQLSGKKKKAFEQKMKEKNARKNARKKGIRQRGVVAEPKSAINTNIVFWGILGLLLVIAVYTIVTRNDSGEEGIRKTNITEQTAAPVAQMSTGSMVVGERTAAAVSSNTGGVLLPVSETYEDFFVDVAAATTVGGEIQGGNYYQLDNSLGVQVIDRTRDSLEGFGLPALEIVIQNTGDKAITLSELSFTNIISTPVVTPEIVVSEVVNLADSTNTSIVIANEGWGSLRNCVLSGTLAGNGRSQRITDIAIGDFDGTARIDAGGLLNNTLGITTPQEGEEILFSGVLSYDYFSSEDVFVPGTVDISIRLVNESASTTTTGTAVESIPASSAKRAILETDKQNYTVQARIFETIDAGQESRLLMVIGAIKSSRHEFELIMRYNGSQMRGLGQFVLHYHLPRSKNRIVNELLP